MNYCLSIVENESQIANIDLFALLRQNNAQMGLFSQTTRTPEGFPLNVITTRKILQIMMILILFVSSTRQQSS